MNLLRILLGAICLSLALPLAAQPAGPPPLSAYGQLPDLQDMVISPNGQRIAALVNANGTSILAVFDKDGERVATFNATELKIRSFDFLDEETLLLTRSTTEDLGQSFNISQFEFYQAIVVPIGAGRETQLIFGNRPGIVRAVFGNYGIRWIDGRPFGFFGGIELESRVNRSGYVFRDGSPTLFRVDLTTNFPRRIGDPADPGFARDWLIGSDGEPLARFDIDDGGRWTIRNNRGERLASGTNRTGSAGLSVIGKDGTTIVYFAEEPETGTDRFFEVPADGGTEPVELFTETGASRLFTDRRTGRLIGYIPRDEGSLPVFFDSRRQTVARSVIEAFDRAQVGIAGWSDDFKRVLVNTSGNGDSGTYYIVDLDTVRADFFGAERPAIANEQVGPISVFEYKAADGLRLDGILTLPPGKEGKDLPLVVLPHGGPHSHDGVGFDWWAQAFASRGYAVFQPNFRGSTNRDEAFVRAGYGEWGRKMQTDISDGVAELARKGIVDPARACIVGASYGGYAALAGVTLQRDIYRCAVAVAPVADLEAHFLTNMRESGRSRMVRRSMAEEFGPSRDFDAISPRQQAARASAPILLIHGRDDTVVDFRQSRGMADALRDAGKPFRFVELEGEDHWLSRSTTRQRMLEEAVAFVQEHNPSD